MCLECPVKLANNGIQLCLSGTAVRVHVVLTSIAAKQLEHLLDESLGGRGFKPQLGQTKSFKIGTPCGGQHGGLLVEPVIV